MKWWGKILGGILGYALTDSIFGLIVGVFLGNMLDKNAGANKGAGFDPDRKEKKQNAFFDATFSVLGHISKSDGHVSKQEIELAQRIMQQMRLSKEQRISAIELFNKGKHEDFNLDAALHEFREKSNGSTPLVQMFIEIQLQAVYADGTKSSSEAEILQRICQLLGYPEVLLEQLESMLFASQRSRQSYRTNEACLLYTSDAADE